MYICTLELSLSLPSVSRGPLLPVRLDSEELRRVHSSVQVRWRWPGPSSHGGKGQAGGVCTSHGTHQGGWVHKILNGVICHWLANVM